MAIELLVLGIFGLLISLVVLGQVPFLVSHHGLGSTLGSREGMAKSSGFAGRIERSISNSITSLTLFAPVALLIALTDQSSTYSAFLCLVYLGARIVYSLCYWLSLTPWRSICWSISVFCVLLLYVHFLI